MKDRNMKHRTIIRNMKVVWCCLNKIREEVSGVGTKSCRKGLECHSRDKLYLVGNREIKDGFKQKSEEGIMKRKQLP